VINSSRPTTSLPCIFATIFTSGSPKQSKAI
jgi:hypothetical protein